MKPKLHHWYVVAYINGPPDVALCTHVNDRRFYFPNAADKHRYWIDSDRQLVDDLGLLKAPEVGVHWRGFRLNDPQNTGARK